MGHIRTSRYSPNKEKHRRVILQPADVQMLDIVYQYPAIDTNHLTLLCICKNYLATRRKARRLVDNGLLLRAPAQHIAHWKEGLNQPASHFISTAGARKLEEHMGYTVPKSNYDKLVNEKVNYLHEKHVADFHVRMTVGCKARLITYVPRKLFIQGAVSKEYQEKYPFKTNTKNHNWELCRFNLGNRQYLQPDDIFAIVRDKVYLFFLEVDQDTVPNTSTDTHRKTIQRMFERYIRVEREGIHTKTYGADNMRVLILAESDSHIANLIKLVKDAPEIFLFGTIDKIKAKSNILDVQFLTNKGKLRMLV
jgi:hypothetical protein